MLEQVILWKIQLKLYHEVQFSIQSWIVRSGSQNIIWGVDSVLILKKNLNLLAYPCCSSVGFSISPLDGHR